MSRHFAWHKPGPAPAGRYVRPTLGALLLLGVLVTSTGCGESSGSPAAVASSPATAPPAATTTASSPATASSAKAPATTGAPNRASTPTDTATGSHKRAHLVLPPPGSHPEPKITASERATLPTADINLSSPAVKQQHRTSTYTIARRYTCRGADSSPPLRWSGVPSNADELALLVMNTTPVNGQLFFDWAVAHIAPGTKELSAGQLPAGAVVGLNSDGKTAYSLCPPGSKPETYLFLLYALPKGLSPKPNFDPATFRQEAMRDARHTGLMAASGE